MKEPRPEFLESTVPVPTIDPPVIDRRAELEQRLATLEDDSKRIRERYLRAAADLENERKLRRRELEEVRLTTMDDVITEMTSVSVAMEQSFDELAESSSPESAPMIEGLRLVARQLAVAFERLGENLKGQR